MCYQDFRSCSSQLAAAYPDSSKFQVLQPPLYSSHAALNVVEESWRVDFCQTTAHISKQVFTRPCADSLLGLPGNAFERQYEIPQFLRVSGLAFIQAQRSKSESWIPKFVKIRTLVCTMPSTHTRSHRRIDKNIRTRARASLNRSRATRNRNCRRALFFQIWERLRALTLLAPPGSSLAFVLASGVPVHLVCRVSGLVCPQL